MSQIEIYTKPGCSNCAKAKQQMAAKGIQFITHTIGTDVTRSEVVALFPEARNLPIITRGGIEVTLDEVCQLNPTTQLLLEGNADD